MVIANAITPQVANAIAAVATLCAVSEAPHQPYRKGRLQDLLDHPDFRGNKSELARALGFKSGAFVHQMLKGIRPILEKTIDKAHTIRGGKYRGWFDPDGRHADGAVESPAAVAPDSTPAQLAELAAKMTPKQQERLMAVAELLASPQGEQIRFSFSIVERDETPTAKLAPLR